MTAILTSHPVVDLALAPLLEPVTFAGLPLASRFVMAPMTRFHSPGGVPAPEVAAYYRRRAEHGVGLLVTEGVWVGHPTAGHEDTVPRMTAGAAEASWRRVVDEVHAVGGRIAAQLWHLGSLREPVDGLAAWTPSGVREPGRPASRAMTVADIDELLESYAEAARVAASAGFDAVEVHAAHGYLLDEFLWPFTNRRTDAFGGSPARRAAFPAAVVRAVRAQFPADRPLIVRFSQFKERRFDARIAETPAELDAILTAFAEAGASALHASQRRFWQPAFPGSGLNLAGWAKRLTGLPTITVGSVGLTRDFLRPGGPESVSGLVQRVAAGEFDLVALIGDGGLLQQLTKRVNEAALDGEITAHLGYDKGDPAGNNGANSRNGAGGKTVLTEVGTVEIAVPRDRDGSFEPQIVKKRQRRLTGVEDMVISLSAKGLTTGEIAAHLAEVYGADVSRQTISTITDKVVEGMTEWQNWPLETARSTR